MDEEIIIERDGKPTAWAIYMSRLAAGVPTGWTQFCTSPMFCTSPCVECREDARAFEEWLDIRR